MNRFLIFLAVAIGLDFSSLAAPVNDDFSSARIVTAPGSFTTWNTDATAEPGEPNHADNLATKSVWFSWTPEANVFAILHTHGSTIDTVLAVYTGTAVDDLVEVASNDDDSAVSDHTSKVQFLAKQGVTYHIAIDSFFGEDGLYTLNLSVLTGITVPANDEFAAAKPISGSNVFVTGWNYLATTNSSEPVLPNEATTSVWWRWQAPSAGRFSISTANSSFDTILVIYDETGNFVTMDDDSGDNHTSVLDLRTAAGARYNIAVCGFEGAMGNVALSITPDPPKPAPAWTLTDIYGNTWNSLDLGGKVIMLDFWATWCGPCVAEIPDLIQLQNKHRDDGLVIVGVSVDTDGAIVVPPFVDSNGVNYISTLETSQILNVFGPIAFIPTTYVIDRGGLIQERFVGGRSLETFEAALQPLLFPPVKLSATVVSGVLTLSWPSDMGRYNLQFTPDYVNWSDPGVSVSIENGQNVGRMSAPEGAHMFRLIAQ